MGLDNDAFRKFVDDTAATAPKKPKPKKKSTPSTNPGIGRGGKAVEKEEDEGPKYR